MRKKIIRFIQDGPAAGLEVGELLTALGLPKSQGLKLREELMEMVRAGALVRRGKRFARNYSDQEIDAGEILTGLLKVTPQGRGFVDLGEAYDEIAVSSVDLAGAIDGDTVRVRVWQGERRREGRVIGVEAHGRTRLTGLLHGGPPYLLEPDDPRLPQHVEVTGYQQACVGQAVVATITHYPDALGSPMRATITRVLGEPGQLTTEVAKALANHGIDDEFPQAVEEEARNLPQLLGSPPLADRLDLRHLPFVTIDPHTARDFDDAVTVEHHADDGSFTLHVAVADVSHYVVEDGAIDQEARRRGCSLYLPDRALHMLPPLLSSSLCSLVPGEDRLAMVVRLKVRPDGKIGAHECAAAIIHSRGRLDYEGVAAALQGDFRGHRAEYRKYASLLHDLQAVAQLLKRRRLQRGSLDLDLPEANIILDADNPQLVRDIVESKPDAPLKQAYNLIEELMIAANEAVGREFERGHHATIWRIHPPPLDKALEQLSLWLASYGLNYDAAKLGMHKTLANVLRQLANHRAGRQLSYLVLRTLKQACYSVNNTGHFGLAGRTYLHFTSPIRRYPDLHVHRLLKTVLAAHGRLAGLGKPFRVKQNDHDSLAAISRESSLAERRSIEVEREVQSMYAASLMRDRLGDEEWGTICGLTGFGFFVALDAPCVEGLVKLENLEGWYEFDPLRLRLFAERGGQILSLGDRLRVRVTGASIARRQIDFLPLPGEANHQPDPQFAPKNMQPKHKDRRQPRFARRDRPKPRGKGRQRR